MFTFYLLQSKLPDSDFGSNKQKAAFFKIFRSIAQKYSAALQKREFTMQNQNKFKKIKESDRNEKIKLRKKVTVTKK